jgi:hypothetical protein
MIPIKIAASNIELLQKNIYVNFEGLEVRLLNFLRRAETNFWIEKSSARGVPRTTHAWVDSLRFPSVTHLGRIRMSITVKQRGVRWRQTNSRARS